MVRVFDKSGEFMAKYATLRTLSTHVLCLTFSTSYFLLFQFLSILNVSNPNTWRICLHMLLFAVPFLVDAWMITVSSWIQAEGNDTKALVHSLTPQNLKAAKAFNLLCMQLNHKNPEISCGIFIIDWSYLFIFISTLFSYFIILVQFESG